MPVEVMAATATASKAHMKEKSDEIAIVLPPDSTRPISPKALSAQMQIAADLKSADEDTRTLALVFQRNLYRLSDDPFYRLQDWVFDIVYKLSHPKSVIDPADQRRSDFIRHAIFHRRCNPPPLGKTEFATLSGPTAPACSPVTLGTFYRTLTVLARYPEWLERLGLAYRAVVTMPAGVALQSVALDVQTIPASAAASTGAVVMVTACTAAGHPDPDAANDDDDDDDVPFKYDNNLLLLKDRCSLVQSDVDGESLRTLQQANSASLASAAAATNIATTDIPDADPPDPWLASDQNQDTVMPSRSVGITLVHADAPTHQTACIKKHVNDLRTGDTRKLGLRDLVRGYSPQLKHGEKWVSLTKRDVIYDGEAALTQEHVAVHLEAAMHNDTPSVTGDGSVPDLHMPQVLFRWNGWTLSAKMPFAQNSATSSADKAKAAPFPINPAYKATDKSLIRLRFGRKYEMQVRLVDLAGVVLDPATGAGSNDTLPLTYTRHDAVPPPELLMEGESKMIESDACFTMGKGETLTTLVRREHDGGALRQRCIVPPVANLDLLIQHGKLDASGPEALNGFKKLKDLKSFHAVAIDGQTGDFPTGLLKYEDAGKHSVSIFREPGNQKLPPGTYLPDPMASLLKADIVDLATGREYWNFPTNSFYANEEDWPEGRRLRVQMDTATWSEPNLRWTEQGNVWTLLVSVPEGWHVKVRLRCVPTSDQTKLFAAGTLHDTFQEGLLTDLRAKNPDAQMPTTEQINKALESGHLPHYTPSRDLDFIHAVQRPAKSSTVSNHGRVKRHYDSPIAEFTDVDVTIGDRRTTGKLELIAAWSDPDDNHLDAATGAKPKLASAELANYHLAMRILNEDGTPRTGPQRFSNVVHTFPDTQYREISLMANSVSRYQQYYDLKGASGDAPFTNVDMTPQTVTVLNTARPAAPRVAKIIPLLPVSESHGHGQRKLQRVGGAFRIYLERPWYTSGFGEMLGVVLWGEDPGGLQRTANFDSAASFVPMGGKYKSWAGSVPLEPFVTRWAADPARMAGVSTLAPTLGEFGSPVDADGKQKEAPIAVSCAFPAETLVDLDDQRPDALDAQAVPYISLAAYPVKFQDRTKLYYADVQINKVPAYNTFIRLALTRYQPKSLVNRECSPIMVAGYAQLLDGRSLTLQRLGKGEMQLEIYSLPVSDNSTQMGNTFRVSLEYQRDGLWLPAQIQPDRKTVSQPDATGWITTTYTFPHQHTLLRSRLRVEEFETWFADSPVNLGERVTRLVPRPAETLNIPSWD